MSKPPARQSWHLVYFALGIFNVVSVTVAVGLSHRILSVYRASIDENRSWSERSSRYTELGALATAANGPGNDVFENRDVDGEQRRLHERAGRFDALHTTVMADLDRVDPASAARLRPGLVEASTRLHAMASEAEAIFAGFRARDVEAAGRHMASMDRELTATCEALEQVRREVSAIQRGSFGRQLAAAARVGQYANGLVGLVVLMVVFVVAYGLKLFRMFAAAQAAIDRRNSDMRLILDNVSQGFVNLAPDGTLSEERSAILEKWLGPYRPGAKLWDHVRALEHGGAGGGSHEAAEWLAMAWESLTDGVLPLEMALDQLPRTLAIGEHTMRLDYQPILRQEELVGVLLVVTDITSELERERADRRQRELLAVFERITRDQRGFLAFFDDADRIVDRLTAATIEDPAANLRDVHTLKGNAGFFGLSSIVSTCQEVEARAIERGQIDDEDRQGLRAAWSAVHDMLRFLIGDRDAVGIEINDEEYRDILATIERGAAHAEIAQRIRAWKLEPLRERFVRIAEQANAISARLGKGPIDVHREDHSLRTPERRFTPFWSAFIHTVRNAADHGLESPEERVAAGKPERGQLWLRGLLRDARFVIEIQDDGRGIQWERIADKARAHGLPHTTREELVEALFGDGISTSEEATDISGRGVGTSAVRAACLALGGTVEVSSVVGRGSTFTFSFPREVIEPEPGDLSLDEDASQAA